MTNQVALALGALIIVGLAIDSYAFDWAATLFLARRFVALIEYLSFWR